MNRANILLLRDEKGVYVPFRLELQGEATSSRTFESENTVHAQAQAQAHFEGLDRCRRPKSIGVWIQLLLTLFLQIKHSM